MTTEEPIHDFDEIGIEIVSAETEEEVWNEIEEVWSDKTREEIQEHVRVEGAISVTGIHTLDVEVPAWLWAKIDKACKEEGKIPQKVIEECIESAM